MRKLIPTFVAFLSALPAAAADLGPEGCPMFGGSGYGMMGGGAFGWLGWALLWLLFIALAAFIAAVIFWGTKKWFFGKKDYHSGSHAGSHAIKHKKK